MEITNETSSSEEMKPLGVNWYMYPGKCCFPSEFRRLVPRPTGPCKKITWFVTTTYQVPNTRILIWRSSKFPRLKRGWSHIWSMMNSKVWGKKIGYYDVVSAQRTINWLPQEKLYSEMSPDSEIREVGFECGIWCFPNSVWFCLKNSQNHSVLIFSILKESY